MISGPYLICSAAKVCLSICPEIRLSCSSLTIRKSTIADVRTSCRHDYLIEKPVQDSWGPLVAPLPQMLIRHRSTLHSASFRVWTILGGLIMTHDSPLPQR